MLLYISIRTHYNYTHLIQSYTFNYWASVNKGKTSKCNLICHRQGIAFFEHQETMGKDYLLTVRVCLGFMDTSLYWTVSWVPVVSIIERFSLYYICKTDPAHNKQFIYGYTKV